MECTRAQFLTMLWRANGSPAPQTATEPFEDVDEEDYYYPAVLWAYQNQITNGTAANAFSPNAVGSRAQLLTFLYRATAN